MLIKRGQESSILSIKCAMLVHGVMQVSVKSQDLEVKAKLRVVEVWQKALRLVVATNLFLVFNVH